MFLIVSKFWVPKGFTGIAVFPFVFVRDKFCAEKKSLVIHEKIHLRQQLEFLIFFFFIWYGIEFLIRLYQYKDRRNAYLNISFEREAYANETNVNYLQNRKFFSFFHYL